MSTQGALTSSPSSSSTPQWTYDIFLSFRGEDTRKNFTDHLYNALVRKGIWTFRDNENLERGNTISKELLKAIEKSRFAIVIFSENYASSKWCLDELVHIVRCMKETGLKVMPVFYHVNPSDVRKQRGTFAQAFKEHKKRFGRSFLERLNKCKSKKMKKWRYALREVANISGWDLQDRSEAEFIRQIVGEMEKLMGSKISSTTKNLVGMESSVQKLISLYLGFGNNVGMIGIYGIGGLGKTTLARVVYDNFHSHFEGSSFIANVREDSKNRGLPRLQQQLLADILENKNIIINNVYHGVYMISKRLCCKKVLLIIDDVDQVDQLENLAREHSWFGLGSCIIITTRDERVLIQHGVLERFKPNGLDSDDASKLFCLNAFKNEQPKEGYMKLSQEVVEYANGLPLAIVTLGSFFVGRAIEEWRCALDGFKKTERKIFDVLKISYDGLAQDFKDIFLHIACFFNGKKKDKVSCILENCGFNAIYGISVLVEKSLLTMDDNKLRMHDLLQEMGERIIRQESSENHGTQSRLWLSKDWLDVLQKNMATEAIQAIVLRYKNNELSFEEFPEVLSSKGSNLRLMIIDSKDKWPNEGFFAVTNDQKQLFIPNQLRHLSWSRCPLKCLSSSSQPNRLVKLELRHSKFEYLWEGVMHFDHLKFIDARGSKNLIRTPDFSGLPMLEGLDFSSCFRLVEIHPSLGQLKKLWYLHMHWSVSLTDLPSMSAEMMQSLEGIGLCGCYNISSVPKFTGIMKSLCRLDLACTAVKKVEASSIDCLPALTFLDLSVCPNLECLPSNMENLRSLETLDLSRCPKLKSLPRLPPNAKCTKPEGFSFLNWSSELVTLSIWSQPLSQWLPFDESGSLVGFTNLFHFLRGLLFDKALLGGYIIRSWSAVQEGFSIDIKLPSNWYNSKWIGFALWASLPQLPCDVKVIDGIRARVIAPGGTSEHSTTYRDSICVLYLSREVWFGTVGNDECSEITVEFEKKYSSYSTVIWGECGVSFIYKQGVVRVDELNETHAPCFIESFGKVSIYKLTAGDDDVHIVDDDGVHEFRDDVHKFAGDDFDDGYD